MTGHGVSIAVIAVLFAFSAVLALAETAFVRVSRIRLLNLEEEGDKRAVVAIVGDGGFSHCWSELECAVRHDIPVKTIVLNNAGPGFQLHSERARFGEATEICPIGRIDHAAIARATGCPPRPAAGGSHAGGPAGARPPAPPPVW